VGPTRRAPGAAAALAVIVVVLIVARHLLLYLPGVDLPRSCCCSGSRCSPKGVAVWPAAAAVGMRSRDRTYATRLMATGPTFGSIAALYGLTNERSRSGSTACW
jgi:hypothetical protein